MYFVPCFQKYSCILLLLNSLILLSLGSFLLLIPQTVVHILLDYDHDDLVEDKEDIFSMTRMAGGVLLAQGLSSLLLLLPMLVHDFGKVTPRLISVTTGQTSIVVQSVTGLLWVIVGLLDDRVNEASNGVVAKPLDC